MLLPRNNNNNTQPPDEEEASAAWSPPGAYYRTKAPLYRYTDPSSASPEQSAKREFSEDAGAFVGLMVCLCLLLLLAFSVSYPLSTYYYTPDDHHHHHSIWMRDNEVYVRSP
jgi:hypothetical protein